MQADHSQENPLACEQSSVAKQRSAAKPVSSGYGRGRPKAGAGSAISTAIMEAAAEIFLSLGFEEASMEAVAARAGITKVTLYKRFPDKRSMLRAVLQARRPQLSALPPPVSGLEARLKYYATLILVQGVSSELRALQALANSAWPDPLDMPSREEVLGYNAMLLRLECEIGEGGKELGVDKADAKTVAAALMAMLSGWFDHRRPDPERDAVDAEAFARKAVELLIHGKAAW